jgi:hypothetical protein
MEKDLEGSSRSVIEAKFRYLPGVTKEINVISRRNFVEPWRPIGL